MLNQLLPVFCCLRQSAHNLTNYGGKALLTGKKLQRGEKNEACCNEKENVLAYNGKKRLKKLNYHAIQHFDFVKRNLIK